MALKEICVWKRQILVLFLFAVNGQRSGPFFMVTFPAVIESGSEAKLCAGLLKPNESLTMSISLFNEKNVTTQLVLQRSATVFQRCFNFRAPQVEVESVQKVKVVIQGRAFKMAEERKVLFRPSLPVTFIQTDKPIYNPGQMVNFRVVTMDGKFVPLDQMYSLVLVEDSQSNRIGQWTNVSSTRWILTLSHELNPEARLGMYALKAFIGERMISQVFEVKKYVLPKFDITVKAPQMCSVGDVGLKVEVCGKYTYGQPVPGQTWIEVCRNPFEYIPVPELTPLCLNKTIKMTNTGCASHNFNMSEFLNTKFEDRLQDSFVINVNLTEEGTDIVITKSITVSLTFEIGNVTFVDMPEYFAPGSTIMGKISASNFNGTPIARKAIYLLESSSWPPKLLLNLTTNQNGLATFSLRTASLPNADVNLVASATPEESYGYKRAYFTTDRRTVSLFQPATPYMPSFSEITIVKLVQPLKCGAEVTVTIKYSFVGESGNYNTDIIYMVLSKGVIILHGFENVNVRTSGSVTSGTVSFKLSIAVDFAPVVQILAFSVLPSENVVAGSATFNTEMCFKNQVSLQFSPVTAVPGEGNVMTLSAQPGSLCGLSAIDQSIRILEPGRRLNAETVFNLLPMQSQSDYPYEVEDEQECLIVRPRRAVPTDKAYETFKSVGLKIATNLPVREPDCLLYRGLNYYRNRFVYFREAGIAAPMFAMSGAVADDSSSSFDLTIRTFFPETWIWQLADVGVTGSAKIPIKVPDTITTWETEAFCLSSNGLGLAPPALLTAFQPFFLALSLPYSIIRGEFLELKATVFNYQSKCIMVRVTPAPSSGYTLKPVSSDSSCLCTNESKTFKWVLTASVLGALNVTVSAQAEQSQAMCGNEVVSVPARGRIDIVTTSLLVLAEGVERIKTQSWLLCPKGSPLLEEVVLTLPANVIQGSARCSVSVIGDIMGRALENLDGLLHMPRGCGEQNIAALSPNIYILQYLIVTQQLTPAIREQATGNIKSGYQNQLNYRHSDGSFSTYDFEASNTWLTAFVLRSFGKAQNFIFIDPHVIQSAKDWLISKQGSDGCFMQQGNLYRNDMKGGVGDNVTMTAYITASLLELDIPATDPVVTSALSCLRSVIGNLGNTYTTALLAYTFSLARETNTRLQLLNALDNVAINDGGRLHWSQTVSGDTLAVEISSYVLLAVLSVNPLSAVNLGYANRIVYWLVAQQNPYGGFSSTQDTVVALQALSLYATAVFSSRGSSTVIVQLSAGGEVYNFDVNRDNRLLYQEKPLKNVPGKYSVKVTGSACVSVQVAMFYNIPPPVQTTKTLSVETKVKGECRPLGDKLMLNFTVTYNGPKGSTNMVIVDIKILSGFMADTSTLGAPPNAYAPLVERVDAEDDRVLVYLKAVTKNVPLTYMLQLMAVQAVKNLKPAVVRVYDYYQTSDQFETVYTSPCI
ncbi:alpha-2-macroglobulin-P-like [Xyrauchen texanus]|uniref:alpha-2-macroglobulin-P-like n=1 Tax=Xyrauchen texanus TaxID=154827 RepID=UPI00224241E3|nr:alpha-2-macroglobulin-P-like [Xyrauchen texanus]